MQMPIRSCVKEMGGISSNLSTATTFGSVSTGNYRASSPSRVSTLSPIGRSVPASEILSSSSSISDSINPICGVGIWTSSYASVSHRPTITQ